MLRVNKGRVVWAAAITVALFAGACASKTSTTSSGGGSPSTAAPKKSGPAIVVGSANFSESETLAEIYAGALEAKGYTVQRKLKIGNREVYEAALEKGDIGFIPEYAATLLEFLNKGAGEATPDAAATVAKLQTRLAAKGLQALAFAPGQDQNGFVVTKATAEKNSFKKLSDLTAKSNTLTLGGPPECPTRKFCQQGLKDVYGLNFKEFKPLDAGGPLTVAALEGGQVDVGLLFTSDAAIGAKGFVLLEDDKKLQLADNVVPVVRKQLTEAYGKDFSDAVDAVSKKLTTDELIKLNKQTGIDKVDAAKAAKDWLKANGFAA